MIIIAVVKLNMSADLGVSTRLAFNFCSQVVHVNCLPGWSIHCSLSIQRTGSWQTTFTAVCNKVENDELLIDFEKKELLADTKRIIFSWCRQAILLT